MKIFRICLIVLIVSLLCSCSNNSIDNATKEKIDKMSATIDDLKKQNDDLTNQFNKLKDDYVNAKETLDTLNGTVNDYVNNTLSGLEQENFQQIERRLANADNAYFVGCDYHNGIDKYFDTYKIKTYINGKTNFESVKNFLKENTLGERDVIIIPFEAENDNEFFEYVNLFSEILKTTNLLIYLDYAPRLATNSYIERDTSQLDKLGYRFSDARVIYDDTQDYPMYQDRMAKTIKSYISSHTKIKFN